MGRPRKVQEREADVQEARVIATDIWAMLMDDINMPEVDVAGAGYAYKVGCATAMIKMLCEALGVEVH